MASLIGVIVVAVLAGSCTAVGSWQVISPDRTPTEPKTFNATDVACVAETCVLVGAQGGFGEENRALTGPPGALRSSGTGIVGSLFAVACASATDCVAVGTDQTGSAPRAVRWDGTSWQRAADPPTTMADIDCVPQGACFATGSRWGSAGMQTVVARLDTAGWTDLSPDAEGFEPTGISCATASFCVVVGSVAQVPSSLVLDDTGWHPLAVAPVPAPFDLIDAVSCPVAGWCLATGGSWGEVTRENALGFVLAAGRWTELALPIGTQYIPAVDCVTATNCTAVGWAPTETRPQAFRFDGNAFAALAITGAEGVETLHAVSCSTATICTAVGTTFGSVVGLGSLAVFSGGTTLTRQPVPTVGIPPGLAAVSCVSPTFCLAVGEHTQRFDGTTWTTVPADDPSSAPGVELTDVDCPSASFCLAVGTSGSFGGTPVLLRWDGQTFNPVAISPMPASPFDAVGCASPQFCMATESTFGGTAVLAWNGTSWAAAPSPPVYDVGPGGVACPAVGRCVVAGRDASRRPVIADWANGGWTVTLLPVPDGSDGGDAQAVSCSTPDSCVVVGDVTHFYDVPGVHWNNVGWAMRDGQWTVTTIVETSPSGMRLSCAGHRCVVVGLTTGFGADAVPASAVWNGLGWAGTDPVPPTDNTAFADIDCVSATWCMAVGRPDTAIYARQG